MERTIGKRFSPLLIFCFLPSAIFFTPPAFSQSQGAATQKNTSGDLPEGNTANQQKTAGNQAAGGEAANKQSAVVGIQQAQSVEQDALAKGLELFKSGEYEKAIKEFLNAQEETPEYPDIPFFIGMAYLQMSQPIYAVSYFKSAIEKDPTYWDAYFQLGTAFIALENFKEALGCLNILYKVQPQYEDLGCLLGMTCYRLERYEDALKYLGTGVISDRMKDITALYTGLARQKLGKRKEAGMGFRNLYTTDASSPLAEPSKRLYDMLRMEETVTRPYWFSATFRTLFDDNAKLLPTENVFSVGPPKSSFGESVFLQGGYSLIKRPDYELNVTYGLYETIYNAIPSIDVQDHIPGMSFIYKSEIGPIGISPRFDYSFDYVLLGLGYSRFLGRHTARPSLVLTEGPHFMTLLSYTFENKDYHATSDVSADNPDARAHETGITQFLRSSDGRHYIKTGYYRRRELASGDNWDFFSNGLLAGAQYTFPKQIRFNADYTWENRNYQHDNIFFGYKRKDIEKVISASLSKDIGGHITVFAEFLKRNNDTNTSLYTYEKNIYSIGMTYRY